MNDYYSLRIEASPCNETITDLIADALAEIGYESFVADNKGVTAYIPASNFSKEEASKALEDFPIASSFSLEETFIEGQDWNEEWEKHYFQPIVIAGQCVVHSSFHHDYPEAIYDIVIDPKMAFGTGHHSTTSLMLNYILTEPVEGKSVIDMGTGSGILSILCKMRGASNVTGIEIDEPAYLNAIENSQLNDVDINFIHGDASSLLNLPKADLFFANINRNVITSDFPYYADKVKADGKMFLSGFYMEDIPVIEKKAKEFGFHIERIESDKNWCALKLSRL